MRALQVLGPSTGGIRVHVATLATGLEERGVAAPVVGPAGVMQGLGPQAAVVPVPSGMSPAGLLAARRALRGPAADADLVHAHGLKAGWVAVGRRVPVVLTLHNVVLDEAAGRAAGLQRVLERVVIRRADRVIAPTPAMGDALSGVVGPDRLRVVVPASPPPVPGRSRAEVRHELGVSDDTPLVVCVSRLHPQKDLTTLVRAWAAVAAARPEARLAIVGDGPQRAELEGLTARLGVADSVILAGFSPHAVDQIAASDVMVLTSVWEAIPLVLAEAMQLGVPVVSTAVGMAPDLLGDGAGGAVVAIGDHDAVATELLALLGDPERARATGAAGSGRARALFDPDTLVDQVLAVYRELA